MKLFAFLMAIIVLTLSCMPCVDESFTVTSSSIAAISPAADENADHSDACSPFCTCNCCAGFSINHQIASVFTAAPLENPTYTSGFIDPTIEVSLPIWQPPQLS